MLKPSDLDLCAQAFAAIAVDLRLKQTNYPLTSEDTDLVAFEETDLWVAFQKFIEKTYPLRGSSPGGDEHPDVRYVFQKMYEHSKPRLREAIARGDT
jgi:hypothetical protein